VAICMTIGSKGEIAAKEGENAGFRQIALRPGQIVLALDAAGNACSVALGRVTTAAPELLAFEKREMQHGHAVHLVPMIEAALAAAQIAMPEIAAIVVGIGPGGFTGLRIALATARGLGLALGVPVIGISNFQASAEALAPAERGEGDIVVLLDSRRSEPYAARLGADLAFRAAPILLDEAGLAAFLAAAGKVTITGDGIALWPGPWPLGCALRPAAADAQALLRLAADPSGRFQAPPLPLYLREPDVSLPKAG
jgi:tRNA threonylcarbamoyladenosine biosynthesis protein TsaB